MLVYAAIAAMGFLVLLAMLFLGELAGGDHEIGAHDLAVGHVDADHGGPSVFSARIMGAFLTAFGVGGILARYYGLSHPAASGVGVAAGLAMSTLVYQFAKLLYGQQASSEVRMATLIGQSAEVSVGIPPGGVGQIALTSAGQRTEHIARAADGQAVPRGAAVIIMGLRGDSVVVAPAAPKPSGGGR